MMDVVAAMAAAFAGEGNEPDDYDRDDAKRYLAALSALGCAVVPVPELAGWAADASTRQAELDEYGYFSVNGVQDRDHFVPLYTIGDTA